MGKSYWVFVLTSTIGSLSAQSTGPVELSSRVLDRDGHHTTWETVWQTADEGGGSSLITNRFVQLATGLNRRDEKPGEEWIPAVAVWETTEEGFIVARQTAHQVILAPNLNTEGAADVLTPDGFRFRATPLGLVYVGPEDTPGAVIATLKDCVAEQVSDTEVLYRDALDNIRADVRFRLGLDRIECDIILREALPPPELFGLDSRFARLVAVTEFFDQVTPELIRETAVGESSGGDRPLVDQWLGFGEMQMVPGRAFALGDDGLDAGVPVAKVWDHTPERDLMFESVDYSKLQPLLDELPALDQARFRPSDRGSLARAWRPVPLPSLRRGSATASPSLFAARTRNGPPKALPEEPGVVLDWVALTTQTSLTLAGNFTYLVSGNVNVQNLTIEGGSAVKYDTTGCLLVTSTLNCRTGPYRPAFFTSVYDATVGEVVATGDPTSGYFGNPMIRVYPDGVTLEHLRFRHAQWALSFELQGGPNTHYLRHAQFVRCQTAVGAYGPSSSTPQVFYAGNLLLANVGTAFTGYLYQGTVEHLTANGINLLANGSSYYGNSTLNVKNSILANVTTLLGSAVSLSGSYNGFWASPTFGSPTFPVGSNPFLTVGAGAHYLGFLSPFWNNGTTSINADLASALKQRTVNPPLERTTSFTQDTILAGYAQRDSDTPDLGYHYEPLDFCWTGLSLNNSTLTLTNGVALGLYGAAGLQLQAGAKLTSQGSPNALNRIVRPVMVQEQYSGAWLATSSTMALLKLSGAYSPRPEVRMRFTEMVIPSMNSEQQRWLNCSQTPSTQPTYPLGVIALTDCQLWGTWLSLYPGWSGMSVTLTNSLLHGGYLYCDQKRYYGTATFSLTVFNNLFSGGTFSCHYSDSSVAWTIRDNFFDRTTVSAAGAYNTVNSNNGYYLATALPGGTANRTVTVTPSYLTGSFGQFYYPASGAAGTITYELTDRGSRTASAAGLFHHTTRTTQSSKDTSTVDIGFHYAATASWGVPTDVDSDRLPDWVEDVNGDGATTGETFRFNNADSDGDGLGDLQEYELQWNVLVNDPAQDYGNEQNSQWQPKVVALGDTVVVGYWDSNQGIYGLASAAEKGVNRMVAWSVSRDGGRTFTDEGVPPALPGGQYGDAGDPVLAIDRVSGTIYFVGTSERNQNADNGVPLWKSVDLGATFTRSPTVLPDLQQSDYPWIAVDDWPGTGQHDVYVTMWSFGDTINTLQHSVSRDGSGGNWDDDLDPISDVRPQMQQMVVGPDHTLYVAWRQDSSTSKRLRMCSVAGRGTSQGPIRNIVDLDAVYVDNDYWIRLLRDDESDEADFFKAFIVPALAVNPDFSRRDDLYVVYTDKGQNTGDRADVFLIYSKDGGLNWEPRQRVSEVWDNDQWMPMVAVRPTGNQLFIAWCDRRGDTSNNSLIDVYGRFWTIAANGTVTPAEHDFRITTQSFPPAFPGALSENTEEGHYDPVWPPGYDSAPGWVNLNWRYPWFPPPPEPPDTWIAGENATLDIYANEHGEHNGLYADLNYVYLVWSDNRLGSLGTAYPDRRQSDVRLTRISWP